MLIYMFDNFLNDFDWVHDVPKGMQTHNAKMRTDKSQITVLYFYFLCLGVLVSARASFFLVTGNNLLIRRSNAKWIENNNIAILQLCTVKKCGERQDNYLMGDWGEDVGLIKCESRALIH